MEDLKECAQCGELYPEDEINEYGNCPLCEEHIQKLKSEIRETEDSLIKYLY